MSRNFFVNLLIHFESFLDINKTIYEINRDCEDYLIEEAYRKSDLVFVTSLTGNE